MSVRECHLAEDQKDVDEKEGEEKRVRRASRSAGDDAWRRW